MYLSKLSLLSTPNVALELAELNKNGAYSAHQLLWRLFTHHEKRKFLFRQELTPSGSVSFYILSEEKPIANEKLFLLQSKKFNPRLYSGQKLGFKLRANPTICITNKNGKQQRHDVMMHAKKQFESSGVKGEDLNKVVTQAAQSWLANQKRLEGWGISLEFLPDIEAYTQHKSKKKNGHHIEFSSVDFQGVLSVEEPEKFLLQYLQGFGRSKAFGCGLMLIRAV